MTWTVGADKTTGDIITASIWNSYMGAGNNFDFLCDGTKIKDGIVYEASLNVSNPPLEGARLVSRAAAGGGLTWEETWQDPMYWTYE